VAIWIAALLIIAAVSLFVAAPLTEDLFVKRHAGDDSERKRNEHQHSLALQGLRELEFDHAMGKLAEDDYVRLKRGLEFKAQRAMEALTGCAATFSPDATSSSAGLPRAADDTAKGASRRLGGQGHRRGQKADNPA